MRSLSLALLVLGLSAILTPQTSEAGGWWHHHRRCCQSYEVVPTPVMVVPVQAPLLGCPTVSKEVLDNLKKAGEDLEESKKILAGLSSPGKKAHEKLPMPEKAR